MGPYVCCDRGRQEFLSRGLRVGISTDLFSNSGRTDFHFQSGQKVEVGGLPGRITQQIGAPLYVGDGLGEARLGVH